MIQMQSESITPYQTQYFAWQLTRRLSSEDEDKLTGAIMDAQIDLNPHQVDAALFAFKNPLNKGVLLADEVKTRAFHPSPLRSERRKGENE